MGWEWGENSGARKRLRMFFTTEKAHYTWHIGMATLHMLLRQPEGSLSQH